jgi:hypothetical protein
MLIRNSMNTKEINDLHLAATSLSQSAPFEAATAHG